MKLVDQDGFDLNPLFVETYKKYFHVDYCVGGLLLDWLVDDLWEGLVEICGNCLEDDCHADSPW